MAFENPQQVPEWYRYDALNLLSYMTLNVKNVQSLVCHKDKLFTVLDYPRNLRNEAKEGLKRTTHLVVYYFAMILWVIPAIQPLLPVPMVPQSIQSIQRWQRAGTPPYVYQREIQPVEPVSLERSDFEE